MPLTLAELVQFCERLSRRRGSSGLPFRGPSSDRLSVWSKRRLTDASVTLSMLRTSVPSMTYSSFAEARLRAGAPAARLGSRSEEHTSELQSLMRISYAVFCLKKKKHIQPRQ